MKDTTPAENLKIALHQWRRARIAESLYSSAQSRTKLNLAAAAVDRARREAFYVVGENTD